MQVKLNGKVLSSDNYEITGYTNNINKENATVTIKGRNDCGGVKTVRFKIRGKGGVVVETEPECPYFNILLYE